MRDEMDVNEKAMMEVGMNEKEKKTKSVSFKFDDNLIFSLNPDRKWN
jgi:hypothetical protein